MIKPVCFFCGILVFAAGSVRSAPLWWLERGILDSSPESDFSPVNEGQLKWTALQAFKEIDAHVPRGNSAAAAELVDGWLANPGAQDFALANIGQGKHLASVLYAGVGAAGLSLSLPLTADPVADYAPLLVGQTKALFDFNVFGMPANPAANPVVTEAVSQGSTYPSSASNADWIEIYNPTASTIDLNNYWLTSDGGGFSEETRIYEQEIWRFPAGTTIAPGAYLVVLATGAADAANPAKFPGYLKAPFKLSDAGEYLALLSGPNLAVRQQFFPRLPKMSAGRSFGLTADYKQATFFATPSPGAANGATLATSTLLAPPTIVPARGFKTASFTLVIQKPSPTAKVYYRLGGDLPERTAEFEYNEASPPTISQTAVVRAFATDGSGSSRKESEYVTSTFVFPAQVPGQTKPSNYPSTLPGSDSAEGANDGVPLDYGMNSQVAAASSPAIVSALAAIPSISIVIPFDSLFDGPNPANAEGHDALFQYFYETPSLEASFEWLDPRPGKPSMQRDMEVSVTGDSSIDWGAIKKKSFKVRFNKDHLDNGLRFDFFDLGAPELVSALAIKNPAHDSWALNPDGWGDLSDHAAYVADQMVARTYRAMSRVGAKNLQPANRAVHVYINGLYWGVYFLHERPDEAYLARHKGGSASQYQSFDDTMPAGADNAAYIDVDSYLDYVLAATFLSTTADWPGNNLRIGGAAASPHEWEFFTWGMEYWTMELDHASVDVVNWGFDVLSVFYNDARNNPVFRQKVSDHLQQLCGPGGALSKASLHARLDAIYNEFAQAAVAESARWGGGYDGMRSPPYGLSDLAVEKTGMDAFIEQFPHDIFEAYNTTLGLGLTNPY